MSAMWLVFESVSRWFCSSFSLLTSSHPIPKDPPFGFTKRG